MARASSKGAPAIAARTEIGAALLIILAIPRLVRLLYPAIWVEDDFYLEAAWLVSAGMRPYLDFVHPHFPLLEYLSAGYLRDFRRQSFLDRDPQRGGDLRNQPADLQARHARHDSARGDKRGDFIRNQLACLSLSRLRARMLRRAAGAHRRDPRAR